MEHMVDRSSKRICFEQYCASGNESRQSIWVPSRGRGTLLLACLWTRSRLKSPSYRFTFSAASRTHLVAIVPWKSRPMLNACRSSDDERDKCIHDEGFSPLAASDADSRLPQINIEKELTQSQPDFSLGTSVIPIIEHVGLTFNAL